MTHESFASAIESHVMSAPLQGEGRGSFSLVGRILDVVRNLLENAGGGLTDEIKATIKAAALSVYDKINIPQFPDVFELPLKACLRPVLESFLDRLLSKFPVSS